MCVAGGSELGQWGLFADTGQHLVPLVKAREAFFLLLFTSLILKAPYSYIPFLQHCLLAIQYFGGMSSSLAFMM